MRTYKAARRRAQGRGIGFNYAYEVEVDVLDGESGEPTGQKEWEERQEHFDCVGDVSTLLLSELAFNSDLDTATPEGMGLIRQFFAQALGNRAEYRRFFNLHLQYGDDDLLMDIMGGLVADFQATPTTEPSNSAVGPATTGETSKVVSLSTGTVRLVSDSEAEELARQAVPGETLESASSG